MFTAAAVCTSVYLKCLRIALLFPALCTDMPQLSSVMADIILLILTVLLCHVVILSDILCISTRLALFMILQFDITVYFILFQIKKVFYQKVVAFRTHYMINFYCPSESSPMPEIRLAIPASL